MALRDIFMIFSCLVECNFSAPMSIESWENVIGLHCLGR